MNLHVEVHGPRHGPVVVLVHGAPDRSGSFRKVLQRLADYTVVVYDRRGYGRSLGAEPATGMRDHAEDLLAVVDGFSPPRVVVAHSFGSNPTMLAASLRRDAFAAIGLWEPPLVWVDWWPEEVKTYNAAVAAAADPGEVVETIYRQILGRAWDRVSPDARSRRRAEGAAFQMDMASELVTPFVFADVMVPALVGYGTASSDAHVRGAVWLAEQLPDAALYAVPEGGHFAHRTHPDAFAAFVRAAVARIG